MKKALVIIALSISVVACNKPAVLSDPLLSSPKSFSVIVTKLNCCSEVMSSSKNNKPTSNVWFAATSIGKFSCGQAVCSG